MTSIWKFLQRTVGAFLNTHGYRFAIDNNPNMGARLMDLSPAAGEAATGRDDSGAVGTEDKIKIHKNVQNKWNFFVESRKKKKWHILVPLAILGKLMHINMMLSKILFGLGFIQTILIAGGGALYYYLKKHTLCKFEPHAVHSHSHVVDSVPPGICLFYFVLRKITNVCDWNGSN